MAISRTVTRSVTDAPSADSSSQPHRARRRKESLGKEVNSGIFSRSPALPKRGKAPGVKSLAQLMDVYIIDDHSDINLEHDHSRFFPTLFYPADLVESVDGVEAITAWVKLMRQAARTIAHQPDGAVKQKAGEKPLSRTSKKNSHQVEAELDAKEAIVWLDKIEELLESDCLDKHMFHLIACVYYVGRLVERIEVRAFERAASVGMGSVKRAATARLANAANAKQKRPKLKAEAEAALRDAELIRKKTTASGKIPSSSKLAADKLGISVKTLNRRLQ